MQSLDQLAHQWIAEEDLVSSLKALNEEVTKRTNVLDLRKWVVIGLGLVGQSLGKWEGAVAK
jgi:hypothetical protein